LKQVARFAGRAYTVDVPVKPKPDVAALQSQLEEWNRKQQAADARGDSLEARNCGAMAERVQRWLQQVADLPEGGRYPLGYTVHRMGDAAWVTCGGEPDNLLQVELRRRFPQLAVLVSPLSSDMPINYLLPAGRYGIGLYQEEPSILGAGCLEALIEAASERIQELFD